MCGEVTVVGPRDTDVTLQKIWFMSIVDRMDKPNIAIVWELVLIGKALSDPHPSICHACCAVMQDGCCLVDIGGKTASSMDEVQRLIQDAVAGAEAGQGSTAEQLLGVDHVFPGMKQGVDP